MKTLFECTVMFFGVLVAVTLRATTAHGLEDTSPVYDIPLLENVVIDGKVDDWDERGFRVDVEDWGKDRFRVDLVLPPTGEPKATADHEARLRLGWNKTGLLVLVFARDDKWIEHEEKDWLWRYDGVEMFLAPEVGAEDMCQWAISPGMSTEQTKLRWHLHDHRKDASGTADLAAARTTTENGYVLEALLPWSALGIEPKKGREVGFQILVNDADETDGDTYHAAWYPNDNTSMDHAHMHPLRLADAASRAVVLEAHGDYEPDTTNISFSVLAPPELTGTDLSLVEAGDGAVRKLSSVTFEKAETGHATATIRLPAPPPGKPYGRVHMAAAGKPAEPYGMRDPAHFDRVVDIARLLARRTDLAERFGIHRPWDDMADSPALIRRHRGLIAAGLGWVRSKPDPRTWKKRLEAIESVWNAVVALDRGEDYLGSQRNEFWSASYNPVLRGGDPFVTVVPTNFDPSREYPLMLYMHGGGIGNVPLIWPDPRAVHDGKQKLWNTSMEHGIGSRAMTRGELGPHEGQYLEVRTWAHWINMDDVPRIIDYMKRWYRIDENRVYALGLSAGGWGTWHMTSHYPDLFAAAAPVCAGTSEALQNLRHIPVLVQHGAKDITVPIVHTQETVDRLQKLGYAVLYKVLPKSGHVAPDLLPRREWLITHRRVERPRKITYTCDTPNRGKAYWLRVHRFADPHLEAEVHARVSGHGGHQALTLALDNVAVLELDVRGMPIEPREGLSLQVGYKLIERQGPLPERLFLVRSGDGWSISDRWSPEGGPVRPYRAGAARNLFAGEPLMLVYGTMAGDERTALLREGANSVARTRRWGPMYSGEFLIKKDTDVSGEDMARFNLVLIGSARENRLTARIMKRLPLTVNDRYELVTDGREPVSLEGAGLRLAHYNPLSPDRLVFIVATDESGPAAEEWLKKTAWLLTGLWVGSRADLVVQTIDPVGEYWGWSGGPVRRQMQFTHGWKWRRVPGGDRRVPETMTSAGGLAMARARVIRRATGADLAFMRHLKDNRKVFEAGSFSLADMAVESTPGKTVLCSLSGRDVFAFYDRVTEEHGVAVWPPLDRKKIEPGRIYRVAMDSRTSRHLPEKPIGELHNIKAGPGWRQEDLWREVFGE